MFDSHGYYGQPGLTAPPFLPQGLFGAAPTAFAPYAAFGTLPGPWGQPTGPSIGGWPGQLPLGAFAPQGLFGGQPGQGQQAQPLGPSGKPMAILSSPALGRRAASAVSRASRPSPLGPSGQPMVVPGSPARARGPAMGPYAADGSSRRSATRSVDGRGRCSSLASHLRGSSPFCRVSLRSRSGLGSRSGRSEHGRGKQQLGSHFGAAAGRSFLGPVPDGLRLRS